MEKTTDTLAEKLRKYSEMAESGFFGSLEVELIQQAKNGATTFGFFFPNPIRQEEMEKWAREQGFRFRCDYCFCRLYWD